MARRSTTSGGVAEASGSNYENLTAAWWCVRILLGAAAQPDFELPNAVRIVELSLQSSASVDDVNLVTSDQGSIFIQAKRTVALTTSATSPFGSAIDQFVRQFKDGAALRGASARPLDRTRDRLVLATRSGRAAKITEVLPQLLRRLRSLDSAPTLGDIAATDLEQDVAQGVEAHVRARWLQHYGVDPTDQEVGTFLRHLWVQTLDVEDGGGDRRSVLDALRNTLLSQPTQAELAFSTLVARCGRLRAERSGADAGSLLTALTGAGIGLQALPDYRADVESLRSWTQTQLRRGRRFSRLLGSAPASRIERAAWPALIAAAEASLLLVGEPGSGKSGLTYRLGEELLAQGRDVVFLPVDVLSVTSPAALRDELGIVHDLADVLRHWPGSSQAVLVVDALDAARNLQAQTILRAVIDDVLEIACRWAVVASVRSYDLRYGPEWRAMFRGAPVGASGRASEFGNVRHLEVQRLTDNEVEQTTAFLPALRQLFVDAHPQLKQLLTNIFNLHLLAELIDQGVVTATLGAIRTQSELLDTYWLHRVHRDDGDHDRREQALRLIVERMVAAKTLKVFRADLSGQVAAEALVDLEQHDLLRGEEEEGGPNADVLLFTHHVLFDYAVARILFRRGRDPTTFVARLRADRTLAVMAAPSLTIAMADVWASRRDREPFWTLALAVAADEKLPATAHLAAPMTAVEFARDIAELAGLLNALGPASPRRSTAEAVLHNVVGAINVRRKMGASTVGSDAGPWMDLAKALADIGTDGVISCLRVLLAIGTENPAALTEAQAAAAGQASRWLLEHALAVQ